MMHLTSRSDIAPQLSHCFWPTVESALPSRFARRSAFSLRFAAFLSAFFASDASPLAVAVVVARWVSPDVDLLPSPEVAARTPHSSLAVAVVVAAAVVVVVVVVVVVRWTRPDLLPSPDVAARTQKQIGFAWLATIEGCLCSFDAPRS